MAERRPVTAREIKSSVEGYQEMSDEAFARRFYSDRAELQGLGVPLTSQRDEYTGEELYNMRSERYFLPELELNGEELSALQTSFYLLEGQFAYAEPLRLALQNLALGRAWPIADPGPKTATVELLGPSYTSEVAQRLAKLEQAISRQPTGRCRYWTDSSGSGAERRFAAYGEFEEQADGSGRFTTAYSEIEPLSAWILSLGGRAVPVEPAELVEWVADDLRAVAEAHSAPARALPGAAAPSRAP